MPAEKIRVGLMVDDLILPAWIYEMVKKVNESACATISFIVLNNNPICLDKEMNGFKDLAYRLYRKIESRVIKVDPDAFLCKNILDIIKDALLIKVHLFTNEGFEYLTEKDIEKIHSQRPDVLIKLGSGNLNGAILNTAKYGVWAYSTEERSASFAAVGIKEVIESKCSTPISLGILMGSSKFHCLCRSYSSTSFAMNKNANLACWKAVSFVPRKLNELYKDPNVFLSEIGKTEPGSAMQTDREPYKIPGITKFISFLFKRYSKFLKRKIWKLFNYDQWVLLYDLSNDSGLLSNFNYKELLPPKDRFWADPCGFTTVEGKHFVFFEEFVFKTKKAHISVVELDGKGNISKPLIILNKTYHLSYPFVFKVKEDIFMIPESSANKTIELYKCKSFPD